MAFDENRTHQRLRNPLTHRRYRRQVFWQVYFPLSVIVLAGLSIGLLSISAPSGSSRLWADIALIFILLVIMLCMTFGLLLAIPAIYLIRRVSSAIPHAFLRGEDFMMDLKRRVRAISDKLVEPFLRYHSAREGVRALRRRLGREIFS